MLTHHFLYAYLNERSIDSAAAELPPLLQNQNNVNFIGTTIAHGHRIVLSMALGRDIWPALLGNSAVAKPHVGPN